MPWQRTHLDTDRSYETIVVDGNSDDRPRRSLAGTTGLAGTPLYYEGPGAWRIRADYR